MHHPFRYRPEIDGLRAVAIIGVVLFHAGLGFPGGFVGVDVFFVLSGYLITSLILKDAFRGEFRLVGFWERRVRRILPASVVMVISTLVVGYFLLLPEDYANLAKSALAQVFFAANFFFYRKVDYFSGPSDEMPLLHMWSLAVEEQFYLILPFVMIGVVGRLGVRRKGQLFALFLVGGLISFAISLYWVAEKPAAAFYLLPSRAWELLTGASCAVLPHRFSPQRTWLRETLCYLGAAGIVSPYLLYSDHTPFPGLAALAPCLGTAMIIAGSSGGLVSSRLPSLARILSWRPVVFVGLISYSLYLWHWPIFAFNAYWSLSTPSWLYRVALVIAAGILAILSWRFIETPFRRKSLGGSTRAIFAYGGVGALVCIVLSVAIRKEQGMPARFSEDILQICELKNEGRYVRSVTLEEARRQDFPYVGAADPAPVDLVVWGDSHARSILPAVDALGWKNGFRAAAITFSATAPVLDYDQTATYSLGRDARPFGEAVLHYIAEKKIPRVLLAAKWSDRFREGENGGFREPDAQGKFAGALIHTVRSLSELGTKVSILMEVPNQPCNVPRAVISHRLFHTPLEGHSASRADYQRQNAAMESIRPALTAAGAELIDASSVLFDPKRGRFAMESSGRVLYYDFHHLTRTGALQLLPLLQEACVP